jgi:hypothetical protein
MNVKKPQRGKEKTRHKDKQNSAIAAAVVHPFKTKKHVNISK